jgi:hypothetical protein
LGGFDDGDLDGLFEIGPIARHAGASHDQHIGAVLIA